jgi:hypothetical protein
VVISAINQFPNPAAAAAAASFLARFVMTAFFAAREEDFGLLGFSCASPSNYRFGGNRDCYLGIDRPYIHRLHLATFD